VLVFLYCAGLFVFFFLYEIIVFTVFFAFFPAGLVLYWVVNNTLSIAQQWVITKNIDKAA